MTGKILRGMPKKYEALHKTKFVSHESYKIVDYLSI